MENSIKESIERLKLCSTNQCHICGRYEKEECMLERNRCEQHILSDYKRVLEMNEVLLKENEELLEVKVSASAHNKILELEKQNKLLRKDVEGWKKYCEEIEEEQTEMSNKNCELEFEVEKLQKENEELKEIYRSEKKMKNEYVKLYQDLLLKENVIPIQKIKDKIEKYKKLSDKFYVKFLESDRYNIDIREKGIKCDAIILALEELIEEREEK